MFITQKVVYRTQSLKGNELIKSCLVVGDEEICPSGMDLFQSQLREKGKNYFRWPLMSPQTFLFIGEVNTEKLVSI